MDVRTTVWCPEINTFLNKFLSFKQLHLVKYWLD